MVTDSVQALGSEGQRSLSRFPQRTPAPLPLTCGSSMHRPIAQGSSSTHQSTRMGSGTWSRKSHHSSVPPRYSMWNVLATTNSATETWRSWKVPHLPYFFNLLLINQKPHPDTQFPAWETVMRPTEVSLTTQTQHSDEWYIEPWGAWPRERGVGRNTNGFFSLRYVMA
jgi:hypothetical protein